jgi:hypothetical protein
MPGKNNIEQIKLFTVCVIFLLKNEPCALGTSKHMFAFCNLIKAIFECQPGCI